jgi:Uma2 family endonuclease
MSETLATTRRWTIADLEGLPDDGSRYELIDGELHVTTAPHAWHQIVVGRVYKALEDWSDQTGAGLTIPGPGVIISPADAVIPDVVWVSRERFAAILGDDGKLHGAPELVVEVYRLAAGALEPVGTLGEWEELISSLLPGFAARVATLFAGLPMA